MTLICTSCGMMTDHVEEIQTYLYPDGSFAGNFCGSCAHKNGFCWGCLGFYGGVETFDFGRFYGNDTGLCDNCYSDLQADVEEGDYADDEYEQPYL